MINGEDEARVQVRMWWLRVVDGVEHDGSGEKMVATGAGAARVSGVVPTSCRRGGGRSTVM